MVGVDLSGVNFTSKFRSIAGPFNAELLGADFRNANLRGCRFSACDLAGSNLRGADLTNADMRAANLYTALLEGANLSEADLSRANLVSAELHDVTFSRTKLAAAHFGQTSISGLDLSQTIGLADTIHIAPSPIGSNTLQLTAASLREKSEDVRTEVYRFLRKAGLEEDLLSVVRTWTGKRTEFYSVFISHSFLDNEFSHKLYEDLSAVGVKSWFDEKQVLPGDMIMDQLDHGIRTLDKVLLVCSKNSLSPKTGWWVEQELEAAIVKERELRKSFGTSIHVLIPVTIDDYVFKNWSSQYRSSVIQRHIGDFRKWLNSDEYKIQFEKLRGAIRVRPDETTIDSHTA